MLAVAPDLVTRSESLISRGIAQGPMLRHQPPAREPVSPVASSRTQSFHVPLGSAPVKTPRDATVVTAGAGAGKTSTAASKFVGLNVPLVRTVPSPSPVAAASLKVRLTPTMSVPPPASDSISVAWPPGPWTEMSRSSGNVCVKPRICTEATDAAVGAPPTRMLDGYGEPAWLSRIEIGALLQVGGRQAGS